MADVFLDDEITVVECGEGSGSGDAVKKTKFKWKEGDKNEIFLREIMHKTRGSILYKPRTVFAEIGSP